MIPTDKKKIDLDAKEDALSQGNIPFKTCDKMLIDKLTIILL